MKTAPSSFFGKLVTRVILAAKAEAAYHAAPNPYPDDRKASDASSMLMTDRTYEAARKLGEFIKKILGDQFPSLGKGEVVDPSQARVVVNGTHGCLMIPRCHAENIMYNDMLVIPFTVDQVVQLANSLSE